jgi:hypothetical protein
MTGTGISAERARHHEALVLRLEALLREERPLAARHPEGPVGPALRVAAEALLHDAAQFHPRRGRREKFPPAAGRLGPLAVELGQARAGLEAFELVHSYWSARHKAFVWRTLPEPAPIGRLRPAVAAADPEATRENRHIRDEVLRRLKVRIAESYEQGYRDARNGLPPPAGIT